LDLLRQEDTMTPVAAGSAIGAAAITVGRGVLGAAASGLSFAAELASAASGAAQPAADNSEQQAAPRAALKQRKEELQQQIQRHFTAHGIQLSEPVELISDGLGGITLAAPHPQEAAIQEALGSDVLLERDFNQLASDCRDLSELLNIAIPHSALRAANSA
jgi:hypothetical protein